MRRTESVDRGDQGLHWGPYTGATRHVRIWQRKSYLLGASASRRAEIVSNTSESFTDPDADETSDIRVCGDTTCPGGIAIEMSAANEESTEHGSLARPR